MNGNRRNHTAVGNRGERFALEPLVGDCILDLDNDEARPPAFTGEELALRFAKQHAGGLRYVDAWGRWLTWDTRRWQYDDTLAAYDLVRQTCRTASAECNRENIALGLASAKTVAAVERLARSDRRLAATADQWDSDPWLLNTPEGIIDLRSGRKFSHRADAYMTKITAVAPNEAHPTPVWEAFLHQVTISRHQAGPRSALATGTRCLSTRFTARLTIHVPPPRPPSKPSWLPCVNVVSLRSRRLRMWSAWFAAIRSHDGK